VSVDSETAVHAQTERNDEVSDVIEIRWHGRAGQGAKTGALLVGEAASGAGRYIQAFPEYGPERMLFGSGFPDIPFFGGVLTLMHADIPDGAKEAIAGGNLRRLLEEVAL